jgi:hypothetical protein
MSQFDRTAKVDKSAQVGRGKGKSKVKSVKVKSKVNFVSGTIIAHLPCKLFNF